MPMTPLIGFVPDLPKTTPGAIVDCLGMIPSTSGMEAAPSAVNVTGSSILPAACRGGAIGENTAGVRRMYAGTSTKLYTYTALAWSDISRAGDYVLGTEKRWSFAQFGDFAIAANGASVIQQANGGNFSDIAGAPTAKIVISAANFVLAFDTVDGTYGTRPDAWWCSGIFDHTTWTPSLSTQANTGRLVAAGGAITAALPFGEQVVAYKGRAMWLGSYVGGAAVWQWQQVQGEVGCVGQEALCDAQGVHVFVGEDNIWAYDGVRPRPLADGSLRQWFIDNRSSVYAYRTIVQYERRKNRVWIFFASAGSDTGRPDRCIVYHMVSGRWGRADMQVDAAVNFLTGALTYDTLNTIAADYDSLPNVSYDSAYWIAGTRALAVFAPGGQAQTLTGPSFGASITIADIGSDAAVTHLDRFVMLFDVAPTSSSAAGQIRSASGGMAQGGSVVDLFGGVYRLRQTAKWHVLSLNFNGPTSVTGYDYSLKPAGLR